MKVQISKIKITNRIRKEIAKIAELSADIQANGLINPITVMPLEDGEFEYQLIAGLRRLRATEMNGDSDIAIHLVTPSNAEAALRIEISENEQREEFTFSEKMDFARMLEEIESAKAKERMLSGKKFGDDPTPLTAEGRKGETREIVAGKIGMGRTTYDCAKYIADNAPEEIIDELDKGQRTITKTYKELRAKEKSENAEDSGDAILTEDGLEEVAQDSEADEADDSDAEFGPDDSAPANSEPGTPKPEAPAPAGKAKSSKVSTAPAKSPDDYLTDADRAAIERSEAFAAMTPEERVEELKRQLSEQRQRAHTAESQLSRLKELRHNDNYHKDGIIENLKGQVARLEEELEAAEARIFELEALYCPVDDAKD
jgi:ParB-like chromosome segregation protein Spo0J